METSLSGSTHSRSRVRPQFENIRLPEPPLGDQQPAEESMVEEYLRIFSKHRWTLTAFALGGALLCVLLGVRSLPVYRTRTSLEIRSLNGDFMNIRSVEATGGNSGAEDDTNLQTQIKLLQSDTLLADTTQRLLSEPHPRFVQRNDLLSRALRGTHLERNEPISYKSMVEETARSVKVKPIGLTRLVEITCDSWSAQLSAKFCNTLTATFQDEDLQTRSTEATKTSDWLTRQVADVRQRAEETQKKLETAVNGNGLMLSENSSGLGVDRLRALEDELVKAEADRINKQATSDVARNAPQSTLPEVMDNPAHRAYELRLEDLRNRVAELVPPLTEENPKVLHLREQIRDAEQGLRATATTSTDRGNNEYAAARHREALLAVALRAQQSLVSSDLQKAAQVSLLRRELDSEQQLYETLLKRAREAGFASAMQASTIRVVDEAKAPLVPFSPRRVMAAIVGLLLGSLIGLGYALVRERRVRVFRMPGDAKRLLQVPELGVIPAAKPTAVRLSPGRAMLLPGSAAGAHQGEAIAQTRWEDNFSLSAEAYRNVTLSILLSEPGKRARTYVISSPSASDGKTTVVSNLGVALGKARQKVVLIDGDLRKPNLHNAFQLDNNFGLRDILRSESDLSKARIETLVRSTGLPNLSLISAGRGADDLAELLHGSRVRDLVKRLNEEFEVILIDTPPVLHMADARILAGASNGAILVLRAGVTTIDEAADARDLFDRDGVNLLGTILNDFDPTREGKGGYYSSYYRYEDGGPGAGKAVPAA